MLVVASRKTRRQAFRALRPGLEFRIERLWNVGRRQYFRSTTRLRRRGLDCPRRARMALIPYVDEQVIGFPCQVGGTR